MTITNKNLFLITALVIASCFAIRKMYTDRPVVIETLEIYKDSPLIITQKVDFIIENLIIEKDAKFEIAADANLEIISFKTEGVIEIRNGANVNIKAAEIDGNIVMNLTDSVKSSNVYVTYHVMTGEYTVNSRNQHNYFSIRHD